MFRYQKEQRLTIAIEEDAGKKTRNETRQVRQRECSRFRMFESTSYMMFKTPFVTHRSAPEFMNNFVIPASSRIGLIHESDLPGNLSPFQLSFDTTMPRALRLGSLPAL